MDPDGTKPREDDLRAARAFTIGKTKDNGLTLIWGETEYSLSGPTDTANGALLCSFHHHVIHNSDWELRMRHGKPEVLAPRWVNPARVWASAGLNRVGLVAHLRR